MVPLCRLQTRGVEVSSRGVSVKTHSKLSNRENYFDATQRGFIRAFNASSRGHSAGPSPNMVKQGQVPVSLKNKGNANSLGPS